MCGKDPDRSTFGNGAVGAGYDTARDSIMKIRLNIFEGPLDLLLYLIKKNHLDIYDIPITLVVEQYLEYLEVMEQLDIDLASEYMVIAANLISIKSKMLLPREETVEEDQEDPRDQLVNQLLEYQKFKEAADFLRLKEQERNKYICRPSAECREEVFIEASIFDLITAFKSALKEVPKDIFFEIIKDEFTIEEKIHDILHLLVEKDRVVLNDVFRAAKSKLEIIVSFLAILELIRLREIVAVQPGLFRDVEIIRRSSVSSAV